MSLSSSYHQLDTRELLNSFFSYYSAREWFSSIQSTLIQFNSHHLIVICLRWEKFTKRCRTFVNGRRRKYMHTRKCLWTCRELFIFTNSPCHKNIIYTTLIQLPNEHLRIIYHLIRLISIVETCDSCIVMQYECEFTTLHW